MWVFYFDYSSFSKVTRLQCFLKISSHLDKDCSPYRWFLSNNSSVGVLVICRVQLNDHTFQSYHFSWYSPNLCFSTSVLWHMIMSFSLGPRKLYQFHHFLFVRNLLPLIENLPYLSIFLFSQFVSFCSRCQVFGSRLRRRPLTQCYRPFNSKCWR